MNAIKRYFTHFIDPKLLIIFFISLAICIIMTMIFSQRVPDFKQKYKSKFYTYVLSMAFVYAVVALLGYNKLFSDNLLYEFIFYQICSLLIGSIHTYMYRSYFEKFNSDKKATEYLFALVCVVYSMIPFMLIYVFLNGTAFVYLMLGHFIVFFVPTFLNDTFNRAMIIPAKIYKTWQFPENYKEVAGVSDEEMRDLVVLTFLMTRDDKTYKYSQYRAKGPTRIDFGRLFYNFVLDYNDKHSEETIQIEDENGKLFSWVFFLQPKWYETTKYVDPNYTLYMNGIEENSVIICKRTTEVQLDNEEPAQPKSTDYEFTKEDDRKRVNNQSSASNDAPISQQ